MVHYAATLTSRELGPADLDRYIREQGIAAELIAPGVPMATVTDAARAIGADEAQILKTLLFWDRSTGQCLLAIARGNANIDRVLLAAASDLARPRLAPAAHVVAITGYRPGGVPRSGTSRRSWSSSIGRSLPSTRPTAAEARKTFCCGSSRKTFSA